MNIIKIFSFVIFFISFTCFSLYYQRFSDLLTKLKAYILLLAFVFLLY